MRCPSTSDLVHAQANHAYDKLAVISDNIEALQAIYDFIFDIKEYLHQRLKEYMHKHKDELIDGQKTFTKPVRLEELELFSSVNADIEDTVGSIKLNFTTCSPYISFKVSRTDDETKEEYVSEVKLILDVCNGKPLLTIPPTNGDVDESSVRVDFLNEQLLSLRSALTPVESNVVGLSDRITSLETKLNNTLTYPEDNSNELVTSDGIYEYGQTVKQELLNAISTAVAGAADANTTYSFALNGNNLIITPNSGNAQTIDLSTIVPSIYNNNRSGSVETEGTYAGYRIWRNGKLAAVFVPGGDSINSGEAVSKLLPFAMQAIVISTHTIGAYIGSSSATGIDQDNGTYSIRLINNGTKVEVSYTSANSSSSPNEENSSNTNEDNSSNENTNTNEEPNTNEDTEPSEEPSEDNSPSTGVFPDITIIGWVI